MKVEIDQIITQIISFLMILWLLSRYAWKPLLKVLDDRKNKIQSDCAEIQEQRLQVDKLVNEYQEKLRSLDAQALQKMNQAIEEAKLAAESIHAEAKLQAKAILSQAQDDLQNEIHQARLKLKNDLVEMTLSATEKVLKNSLNEEQQKKYVSDIIDQLEVP